MRWHRLPDPLDRLLEKYGHWHRWFAWYPVQIGTERVWWTSVWRRLVVPDPQKWRAEYYTQRCIGETEQWQHCLSASLDEILGPINPGLVYNLSTGTRISKKTKRSKS